MAKTGNFSLLKMFRDWILMFEGFGILTKYIILFIGFIILSIPFYYIIKYCIITLFIIFINFFEKKIVSLSITDIIAAMTSSAISIGILIYIIILKNWLELFNKIKGIGIFIEAGILLVLNFSLLYLYKEYYVSKKEYIISFISSNSSATDIFAILTSLVLSGYSFDFVTCLDIAHYISFGLCC